MSTPAPENPAFFRGFSRWARHSTCFSCDFCPSASKNPLADRPYNRATARQLRAAETSMRRYFLYVLAALEAAVAAALVVVATELPTRADVGSNFDRVSKVTSGTETQVRLMREQVVDLRRQDLAGKADELRRHTRTAADTAGRQRIDFRTVEAIAGSLRDVSKGLTTWADTVDAERMKQVSAGL